MIALLFLFLKGFFENARFEALLKLDRTKILRLMTNCLNATTELFFFAHDSDFASSGDNSPLVAFTETWKNFPARWFPQNAGLLCPEQIEGGAVCRCGVFYRTLTRCMLRPCGAWIYSSSHSVVWTLWLASLSSMLPHSSRRLLYSCWHFCVFAGEGFTYLHIVSVVPCVLKIENENLWGCWPSNLAWHSFTHNSGWLKWF